MENKKVIMVMGNHEENYCFGIPHSVPEYMSEGEVAYQKWVGEAFIEKVSTLPYIAYREACGKKFAFLHYARDISQKEFLPIIQYPTADSMDKLFDSIDADIVIFGHDHLLCDISGKRRYLNPGSIGCSKDDYARYLIVEFNEEHFLVEKHQVAYDKSGLFQAFEEREIPEKDFIAGTTVVEAW